MGLTLSKVNPFRSQRIKLSDIDADGNGIITREEVHEYVNAEVNKWKNVYDQHFNEWKDLYEEKLSLKDETIEELRTVVQSRIEKKEKEIEKWKASYDDLHQKYSDLLDQMRNKRQDLILKSSNISPEAIEEAVKDILSDPNLNLKKVPDFVEKRIYHNIIWITLMALERVFAGISVDAFGHEFHLTMNPKTITDKKNIASEIIKQ